MAVFWTTVLTGLPSRPPPSDLCTSADTGEIARVNQRQLLIRLHYRDDCYLWLCQHIKNKTSRRSFKAMTVLLLRHKSHPNFCSSHTARQSSCGLILAHHACANRRRRLTAWVFRDPVTFTTPLAVGDHRRRNCTLRCPVKIGTL